MHFWLSKNSEIPIREQLITQIRLAILSDDLKPGQKLPSTRELARRFRIHANTVSAAYRDLAERGWVNFHHGSGVYVRKFAADTKLDAEIGLDQLISEFLRVARSKGFSLAEIQSRIKRWLEFQPPDHFLLIEPDDGFRKILAAEIQEATGFRVAEACIEDCANAAILAGAAPVAVYGQGEIVRAALPAETQCLLLRLRSITETLRGQQRPAPDALIAVVSEWPDFLKWARAVLVAVNIDPLALDFRDARKRGWQRGLNASAFVITDAVTAKNIPSDCDTRIFHMISDASLLELKSYVAHLKTN
ncbi:MAG TPA: GntR family transcriptional regulator [Blastocatellia bacterium]|nr:GntR family transcriptional regulator [Blastocatellia bacterium]